LAKKYEENFCYRTEFPRIAAVFHGKALAWVWRQRGKQVMLYGYLQRICKNLVNLSSYIKVKFKEFQYMVSVLVHTVRESYCQWIDAGNSFFLCNILNSSCASPCLCPVSSITLCFHNSMTLVHERTIPTERPPLVGEVSANFCR
jgi:hypothetical protein